MSTINTNNVLSSSIYSTNAGPQKKTLPGKVNTPPPQSQVSSTFDFTNISTIDFNNSIASLVKSGVLTPQGAIGLFQIPVPASWNHQTVAEQNAQLNTPQNFVQIIQNEVGFYRSAGNTETANNINDALGKIEALEGKPSSIDTSA